jgi:hypothetical protein
MRRMLQVSILSLSLAGLNGCADGRGKPLTTAVAAPHEGSVFPLPDGAGNVEVLVVTPKGSGKRPSTSVQAYFYKPDMSTLSPAPTDVLLKLDEAGSKKTVALMPKAGKEPVEFASEPGNFRAGLSGELAATIDGKTITVPITVR